MLSRSLAFGAWLMTKIGGENMTASAMFIGTLGGMAMGHGLRPLNGQLLITRMNLQPFIVTLGTMSAFRGIAYVMNDGQPYNVPTYTYLGTASSAAVPHLNYYRRHYHCARHPGAALYVTGPLYLRHRFQPRSCLSTPASNVKRKFAVIYTLAGLLCRHRFHYCHQPHGFRAAHRRHRARNSIIAAVVAWWERGLNGGRGTESSGTIIGTLLISFLRNGCTPLGISTNVQLIVIGIIIIVAVSCTNFARRQSQIERHGGHEEGPQKSQKISWPNATATFFHNPPSSILGGFLCLFTAFQWQPVIILPALAAPPPLITPPEIPSGRNHRPVWPFL